MKFIWNMPAVLIPFYKQELGSYLACFNQGLMQNAWQHLERAHILGQPYPVEHTAVHWEMLRFGFKTKNAKEVVGQLPRLLVGGVKSWAGKIPVGNTGGADVPPLRPMQIPDDLQQILQSAMQMKTR